MRTAIQHASAACDTEAAVIRGGKRLPECGNPPRNRNDTKALTYFY